MYKIQILKFLAQLLSISYGSFVDRRFLDGGSLNFSLKTSKNAIYWSLSIPGVQISVNSNNESNN